MEEFQQIEGSIMDERNTTTARDTNDVVRSSS
jgi:hypothetical protein